MCHLLYFQKNINDKAKKICFGLHDQKNRIGRKVGFFSMFCHYYFIFYCMQTAYGTLKQNLVKF